MIRELIVNGFRGIPDQRRFPLKQITFLSGRNGLGKTTFFDAIDWCLFGDSSRLGSDIDSIRNLYTEVSLPYVQITLLLGGSECRIRRTIHGTASRVSVNADEVSERDLLDMLITDRQVFSPYSQDTAARVRGLVYLEQAQIRSIVSADSEAARTELFQALLGIPHVSTVRASLRKVADNLDAKLRTASLRIDQLEADLSDPSLATAHDSSAEVDRRTASIRLRAREALPSDLSEVLPTRELHTLLQPALNATRRKKQKLDDALSAIDRLELEFDELSEEAERRRGTLAQLEIVAAETDRAYVEARARREAAESHLQSAREERNAISSALDAARRNAVRRASLERLQAEAVARRAQRVDAANTVQSVENRLAAARTQTELATSRARDLRGRLGTISLRNERRARLSRLTNDSEESARRLNDTKGALEQQSALLSDLHAQDGDLEIEGRAAARAYEALVVNLEARERAASLALELRAIIADLSLTECPTCGSSFTSAQELLDHVDRRQGRTTVSSRAAADARHRVDDVKTRRDVLREHILTATNILAQREQDRRALESHLAEIESERSHLASQDSEFVDEPGDNVLGDQLEQAERAAIDSAADQHSLERQSVSAARRLADATSALADTERRLVEEEPLRDSASSVDPVDLEGQLRTALSAVDKNQMDANEAGLLERRGEEERTDSFARLEAARSALRRAEGRLEMTSGELTDTIQSAGGPEADRQTIRRTIDELIAEEMALQSLIDSLDELRVIEEQNEALQRLRNLETRKQAALVELQGLERAKVRFASIESSLAARASSEERSALVQQRSAIQECFRALLPHKHLDEIDIDPENGAILVSDYLLQRDNKMVKAYRYLSTGQANALAVSIFVGIALRQRIALLNFLLVDEPVQNLDDVHFLAFMALVKRVALDRQVIFSTADANIAEIFRRQIKSTWHRYVDDYVEYEWQDFAPLQGPMIAPRY